MVPVHLLLVEDSPGDVLLIREAVRHGPVAADVTIAEDGPRALALLNEGFKPDLIILDLTIPRLDGYAVLERIMPCPTPVVVFTWAVEGAERAVALGACDVIEKPSELTAFFKAVCRIMDKWAGSRANAEAVN
jgi:CheY-like chemotaxis protein